MPKKGYKQTKEHKKKISESHKGEKHPMWGKHHTEESKKKSSESLKGQLAWNKGLKGFNKGRIMSEETKKKIGEVKKGENNYNWQGGKSFEPYGLEFNNELRKSIRKRDDYTCQQCGYTEEQLGYHLSCHHIDYNKQNNSEDNLICLCRSCHSQTGFNREDWIMYFKNKGY